MISPYSEPCSRPREQITKASIKRSRLFPRKLTIPKQSARIFVGRHKYLTPIKVNHNVWHLIKDNSVNIEITNQSKPVQNRYRC